MNIKTLFIVIAMIFTTACSKTAEQKIVAYATETTGLGEQNILIEITNVPEIVYFPKIRALGIQGHPEWDSMPIAFNHYCQQLIEQLLLC